MTTTLKITAAVTLLSMAISANAQIPVTVTSDIPSIINQVETMMQWANQLKDMQTQITNMDKQFASMNGVRGMAALLDDPSLREYLPVDMQDALEEVSGSVDRYKAAGRLLDSGKWQNAAMEAAERLSERESAVATDQAMSERAYEKSAERIEDYKDFVSQIDGATDPKAIADLQARIQSESVFLQNEQIRLQALAMAQQNKREMAEVRARERRINMTGPSSRDYTGNWE